VTTITPPEGWNLINARELWDFRELLYFLAWRDVKIRYKQTLLGMAWAVLQPALMMVVFTIFFSRMAGVSSADVPYPLFVYAGLLPWTLFSTAVTQAGNSVVGSERLITKIYFPRLAVPFASVGAAVVDFAIAMVLLAGLMAYYRIVPGPEVLLLPLLVALILLAALGVGTLLAALNVAYRDFRYVIPFLVQIWLFATPSVYMNVDAVRTDRGAVAAPGAAGGPQASAPAGAGAASSGAPARTGAEGRGGRPGGSLRALLALNPLTPLITAFRSATLGGPIPWGQLGVASVTSALAFVVGCLYFRKLEDEFADIV
jgi:lipopolysaccharide transport system permease protein